MSATTAIKERPILFRGAMVNAILDGRKTQTRRIVKPQPAAGESVWPCGWSGTGWAFGEDPAVHEPSGCFCRPVRCPYGVEGDRLWVRETFSPIGDSRPSGMWSNPKWVGRDFFYAADNDKPTWGGKWRPSIFMPRWACRLVLEVTDVRVERLNDISDEDGVAEGFDGHTGFLASWGRNNGPGSIAANPWVWVVSFRRLEL